MAASTDNLNLTLPATTENYSITILNSNFTAIDDFAGTVTAAISDTSIIADNTISGSSTYSSSKINTIVGQAQSTANQANGKADANASAIEDIEEDVDRVDSTATLALQTGNTANGKADANATAIDELSDSVEDGSAIGNSAITTDKINDGAVTTAKIYDGAITRDKILNGEVTGGKIATGAITADKIGDSAITTNKIASGNVSTDRIANSAITTQKIATNAVTETKLSADLQSKIRNAGNLYVYTGEIMPIGTWFGNLPIWRFMFQDQLTAEQIQDRTYDPLRDVLYYTGSTYDSFVINAYATINFGDSPTIVDTLKTEFGAGTFSWNYSLPEDVNTIYGVIDFVTPEENIK